MENNTNMFDGDMNLFDGNRSYIDGNPLTNTVQAKDYTDNKELTKEPSKSTRFGKRVYIAHPFGGKTENMTEISKIIENLYLEKENQNTEFISPTHAFGFMYKFRSYIDGMKMCFDLLDICDEVWFTGQWYSSAGCLMEYKYATNKGIRIRIVDGKENEQFIRKIMNATPDEVN